MRENDATSTKSRCHYYTQAKYSRSIMPPMQSGPMKKSVIALLMTISLLISPVVAADDTQDIPANVQMIEGDCCDSLVAALVQAELVTALQAAGPFTVFAPTDAAFAAAGIDLSTFDTDAENATLADILLYHVVGASVPASAVTDGMTAAALNGDHLLFAVDDSSVSVNDANVVSADIAASNGMIHVIDQVLMPPTDVYVETVAFAEPYYNFYGDSAGTSEISELDPTNNYKFLRLDDATQHPFYISDQGYETPHSDKIHIVGDGSYDDGISGQESFTLFFKDGFSASDTLHYYCTVHSAMLAEFTIAAPELVDIPTIAQGTGVHNSLVAAVVQAELLTTLQGDGPFTVFAPTDDAFAAAGIDLSTMTTEDGKAALADILLYHVVSGAVTASDVTDGMTAQAVNLDDLTFTVGEGVMVNDANVVQADVMASNGVIHVIDKVLMPPAEEPVIPEGCDYVVGIDESGFAFDQADLSVAVGETVCWIWTDESMAHNVAQINNEGDTSRKMGGAYSGQAETTVDYRMTFDEDGTFHYICEPHVSMDMVGVVTIGTGVAPPPPSAEPDTESVPGFLGVTVLVAMLGAALVAGRRNL